MALKDLNFSDLSKAPDISNTQGFAMVILFGAAFFIILLMYLIGLVKKHPKSTFWVGLSVFVVYSVLLFLIGAGVYPLLVDELSGTQQSYRMISIPIASGIILLGSMIFLLVKFSDDMERRWFMLAVRQEIKHPSKVICPVCGTAISIKAAKCYKCQTRFK